jgi:hypothetical protein
VTLGILLFAALSLVLLLALVYLLRRPAPSQPTPSLTGKIQIEELFPLHCRHFPQMRQALSAADAEYVRRRCSRSAEHPWKAERRRIVRRYLNALGEDFVRLDRLHRTVAALSPDVVRAREAEWFWLSLRFRLMYRLVELRLAFGWVAMPQLARLVEMVGSFAAEIEAGMAALEKSAVSQLPIDFSA